MFVFFVISIIVCWKCQQTALLVETSSPYLCVHWIFIFLISIHAAYAQSLSLRVSFFSLAFRFLRSKYHNRPTEMSFYAVCLAIPQRGRWVLCYPRCCCYVFIWFRPSVHFYCLDSIDFLSVFCLVAAVSLLPVYIVYHLKSKEEKKYAYMQVDVVRNSIL